MKGKLIGVMLLTIMLASMGCGNKKPSVMKCYGDGSGFFAQEGFVISGTPVKLLDTLSNQTFIACSIMNCDHTADSEECEANLEGNSRIYTVIYDGKMYYFQTMYEFVTDVWVKELSSSGRTKVTTIPYQYEKRYFLLYDGKMYFSATEAIDEDKTEEGLPFLVEFDLNTYEHRKITEGEAYEDYSYDKLEILDGVLYYEYNAYMPDYFKLQQEAVTGDNILEDLEKAEEHRDYCVCKVDLNTLEKTQLFTGEDFERYELSGVSGKYLVFYDNETRGAVRMTSTGEAETLVTPEGLEAWEFGVYSTVMGDYIATINYKDNSLTFLSVESGKETKRSRKGNEPLPFLYNEEIDSVVVLGDGTENSKYRIIGMEDFISGNFE